MSQDPIDTTELLEADGLYHLATREEWASYQSVGLIDPPSLTTEGFVHCSWGHQVAGTVARHFVGVTSLLALRLDPESLGPVTLVVEDSYRSGQGFPHAYGAIDAGAVLSTHLLT